MGISEDRFVSQCAGMTPLQILNWYRNLYHAEDEGTERRIMAEAINKLFMEHKEVFTNK